MHCPSCGTDTTIDQRFCRSCGKGLETISKLVAEHSSPDMLKHEKSLSRKANELRLFNSLKWGMMAFILGMAVLFLVKTIGLGKGFNLIGGALLFISMGWMCYAVLSPMRDPLSRSRKFRALGMTGELPETANTTELAPARVPVPIASITERTTQLISADDTARRSG
jgi:hypothetical protein